MVKDNPKNKIKILVVDDEPDVLKLLAMCFPASQYIILCASDGQEALRILEKELPDVILLDIMMPVLNGWEVCRVLKADGRFTHIPVIFLTAKTSDADMREGLNAGGATHVIKPFDPEYLRETVEKVLKLTAKREKT